MLPACCLLLYRNFVEIFENDNRSDTAISFAGIMTVVNYDGTLVQRSNGLKVQVRFLRTLCCIARTIVLKAKYVGRRGIRTPIARRRVWSPAVRRPPILETNCKNGAKGWLCYSADCFRRLLITSDERPAPG
jgi:hypothetical protein